MSSGADVKMRVGFFCGGTHPPPSRKKAEPPQYKEGSVKADAQRGTAVSLSGWRAYPRINGY